MNLRSHDRRRVFAILMLIVLISAMLLPMISVHAKPNSMVEKLIMVGQKGLEYMKQDVANEERHDGDVNQHEWVYDGSANPFGGVASKIDNVEEGNKQAVIIWMGEDYVDSRIPGYNDPANDGENKWFDNDWLGRDGSDKMKSDGAYSGTALGRALSGYDYYVLEERHTEEHTPESGEIPEVDGVVGAPPTDVPDDSVHNKYPGQGPEPEPEMGEHQWEEQVPHQTTPEEATLPSGETAPAYDTITHTQEYVKRYKYYVEVKVHKEGYAEKWMKDYPKLQVFFAAMGPQSKALKDDVRKEANDKVMQFNSALRGSLRGVQFLDVYQQIVDHNPYYRKADGSVPPVDATDKPDGGRYYDSMTNTWLFHMLWNTILQIKPEKYVPPEPLDFSFYSISSSLTAYMNTVLSPAAPEAYSEHTILNNQPGVGNAGAFMGYGDEKYGFHNFITTSSSKVSSVVSYDALQGLRQSSDSVYDDIMHYSQYGYLLNDLGLDQTSNVDVGGIGRWLPGGAILLSYSFSSMSHVLFNAILDVLTYLNPFEFLNHATTISNEWKQNMKLGNLDLTGSPVVDGVAINIMDMIGQAYDGFQNIGVMVVLPASTAFLVAGILLFWHSQKSDEKWSKLKKYLFRFVFICVGIPILGCFYASALNQLHGIQFSTTVDTSQLVASTFVDFEAWVRDSRLSPENMHTEPEYSMSDKGILLEVDTTGNGAVGQASDQAYAQLRHTALNINRKSGVLPHLSLADLPEDEAKWSSIYLTDVINSWENKPLIVRSEDVIHETSQLIRRYMGGSFYQASDWESDVLSVFSKYHANVENKITGAKDEVGRLISQEEQDRYNNATDDGSGNRVDEEGHAVQPVPVMNGTMYEMFDNTNESSDWLARPLDENSKMFVKTDSSEPLNGPPGGDASTAKTYNKWQHFNLMANGSLTATESGNLVKYGDATTASNKTTGCDHDYTPMCPCTSVGLSSLSMYNYLSTAFNQNDMMIYSNTNAHSMISREGHFAVNIIGDGAMSMLFGFNCFVVLGVATVLSIWYAMGMMINIIKRSMKVLMAIPGAAMGVLRSITQVIVCVLAMILEVIMTLFTYSLVMQMIMVFVETLDITIGGMTDPTASAIIGGRMANALSTNILGMADSKILLILSLIAGSAVLAGLAVLLVRKAGAFHRCYASVMEYLWLKYICCPEVAREVVRKESEKSVSAVGLWKQLIEVYAVNSTKTLVVAK